MTMAKQSHHATGSEVANPQTYETEAGIMCSTVRHINRRFQFLPTSV